MPKVILVNGDPVAPVDAEYERALAALAVLLDLPPTTDAADILDLAVERLTAGKIIDCWQMADLPDGSVVLPCRADGQPFALAQTWPAGSEPFRTGTPAASMAAPYPDSFFLLLLTGSGPTENPPVRAGETFLGRDLPKLLPGTMYAACDETGRPLAMAVVFDVPEYHGYRPASIDDDTRCVIIAPPDGGA